MQWAIYCCSCSAVVLLGKFERGADGDGLRPFVEGMTMKCIGRCKMKAKVTVRRVGTCFHIRHSDTNYERYLNLPGSLSINAA